MMQNVKEKEEARFNRIYLVFFKVSVESKGGSTVREAQSIT